MIVDEISGNKFIFFCSGYRNFCLSLFIQILLATRPTIDQFYLFYAKWVPPNRDIRIFL